MLLKDSRTEGVVIISSEDDNVRCCGIKYKDYILTSGVILSPYIESDSALSAFYSNKLNNTQLLQYFMKINGIPRISDLKYHIMIENNKCKTNGNNKDKDLKVKNYCNAFVTTIFKSDLVYRCLRWNVSGRNLGGGRYDTEGIHYLLSIFVLLQLGEIPENAHSKDHLTNFLLLSSSSPISRGTDVLIESTPFAMKEYMNSWSKGIVSSILGDKDCVFLTDNRLVNGCIGAPVYSTCFGKDQKGNLLGMVLNPMLSSRSEWAGFSLAVNLHVILKDVLNWTKPIKVRKDNPSEDHLMRLIGHLDNSVVLVRCGLSWGSGVIVDSIAGIIITCSHVVNYKMDQFVMIECGSYITSAAVIYCTKENHAFDLAVLCTVPSSKLQHIPLSEEPPVTGETVFCVGYPLFDKGRVALSKGVVSKVVDDILIQTTCCILPGVSGGAIVRPNGQLIGVPVNNLSCAITSALYPHFNYAIPVTAFSKSLNEYLNTKDANCLGEMTSNSPYVQQQWLFDIKSKM